MQACTIDSIEGWCRREKTLLRLIVKMLNMVCVKFAKTTTLQKVIRKRRVSKFVIYICQWSWRFNAFFLFRILGLILMFLVYTDLMLHISPLYIIIHFIKGIQIVSNCNLAECQPFLVPKTSIKKVLLRIIIDKLPL